LFYGIYFFFINNILLFLIIIFGTGISLWIYSFNPKEATNRLFLIFTLCNILWIAFTYLSDITPLPDSAEQAILYRKLRTDLFFYFLFLLIFSLNFRKKDQN